MITLDTPIKVLTWDGRAPYGRHVLWPMPKNGEPGPWTRKRVPRPCRSGYHLTTIKGLHTWALPTMRLFIAEGRGDMIEHQEKVVWESARLLQEIPWEPNMLAIFTEPHEVKTVAVVCSRFHVSTADRIALARWWFNGQSEKRLPLLLDMLNARMYP